MVQAAAAAAAAAAANAEAEVEAGAEAEAAHTVVVPTLAEQVLESSPGVPTPAWQRASCSACRLSVVRQ